MRENLALSNRPDSNMSRVDIVQTPKYMNTTLQNEMMIPGMERLMLIQPILPLRQVGGVLTNRIHNIQR